MLMSYRYQSRAFLLFPMCFNIGVIIGPVMGGLLSDPAQSYPGLFGDIAWMKKYPYALPNLVSAAILFCSFMGVFLGLNEVRRCHGSKTLIDNHRLLTRYGTKRISEANAESSSCILCLRRTDGHLHMTMLQCLETIDLHLPLTRTLS